MFYNRLKFIVSGFLNKIINYNILRFNLSLLKHYLPLKLYFKKASLKQLRKRLSKRLLKLRKKSNNKLRKVIKLRSLTCDYNKLNMWVIWLVLIKNRFRRL
jgi:hypothetical protein